MVSNPTARDRLPVWMQTIQKRWPKTGEVSVAIAAPGIIKWMRPSSPIELTLLLVYGLRVYYLAISNFTELKLNKQIYSE